MREIARASTTRAPPSSSSATPSASRRPRRTSGKRHADTIALLEKFLQNHPNHETFTPDAMFRLADLYLDQADERSRRGSPRRSRRSGRHAGARPRGDRRRLLEVDSRCGRTSSSSSRTTARRRRRCTCSRTTARPRTSAARSRCSSRSRARTTTSGTTPPPAPPTKAEAIKRVESKTLRDPYADCQGVSRRGARARAPRVGARHRRLPLHRPRRDRRRDRRVPQGRQRRQRLQALRRVALQARVELLQARLPAATRSSASTRA